MDYLSLDAKLTTKVRKLFLSTNLGNYYQKLLSLVTVLLCFRCPLDTSLFEGFYPVAGSDNRILRAAFQGFRFQTKRRVNINCNVNFCFRFCQPVSLKLFVNNFIVKKFHEQICSEPLHRPQR